MLQPIEITILPSLKIFDYNYLFRKGDGGSHAHYTTIPGLFRETFEVNLLPGIYVYDFKE